MTDVRITQQGIEVLHTPTRPNVYLTQQGIEVLRSVEDAPEPPTEAVTVGSDAYTLVAPSDATEARITNIGPGPIYLKWAASQPLANAKGHLLQVRDTITRTGLTGPIYAIGVAGGAEITVSKELP